MKRVRSIRITKGEAQILRDFIKDSKKRMDKKQAGIIGFAKMFGKFLPECKIVIGVV